MTEAPRYRLLQKAYMRPSPDAEGDQIVPEGAEVTYLGVPGPHMEPLNDAARAALETAPKRGLRPEMTLPLQGPHGGEAGQMQRAALGYDVPAEGGVSAEMLALALVRIGALEARVTALETPAAAAPRAVAPPPPPPPPAPRRSAA